MQPRIDRNRRAQAILVILLTGVLAARDRAGLTAEDPSAEGEARQEVERLLQESSRARGRSDLAAAASLASRAFDRAQVSLRGDDPMQVRAAGAHFSCQCDDAVRRDDIKQALAMAGMAASFAGDRDDFKTADEWTRYAGALADRKLKPTDPIRTGIAIALAEFQAREAIQARDRDRAVVAARRAVALGRPFKPGDPNRARLMLLLARVLAWRGEDEAALKLCDAVEEETRDKPAGNEVGRVEALIRGAGLRAAGDEPIPPEVAPRLAEAFRRAFGDRFYPGCELASRAVFWGPRLERALDEAARGQPAEAVESRLARDLDRFGAVLRDAGVDPPVVALGRLDLSLFQLRGQRLAAADETLKSLAGAIEDPRITPALAAEYWTNRGAVEIERANYDVARQDFETALRQDGGLIVRARALNNLGDLAIRAGDYTAAVERLERSIALYRDRIGGDSGHALALRNLADARDRMGDGPVAERLRREAIERAERASPPDPYALYLCRNSLGRGDYEAGRFGAARAEFERSRQIALDAFGRSHFHVAEAEVNLGWIALTGGRTGEALAAFGIALAIFRENLGPEHPRVAEVLGYVARVHAAERREDEARSHLESALALRERQLDRILRSAFSERDRLALVQELRVHPEASGWPGVLDTYLDLAPGLGISAPEQYRRILTWKGVLARHAPPRVDELEDDAETRRLAARREALMPKLRDASFLDARGEVARAIEAEVDSLERTLRERSGRFARGAGASAPGLDQVVAVLPPRSALLDVIEIRRYRPREEGTPLGESLLYVAILVQADRPVVRIDLGEAATLDGRMIAYLDRLAARDDVGTLAEDLARAIRTPLVPHLDSIKTLIVSADGLLGRLPWGALPGRRPGTSWIDDLAFASVPSAQSLVVRRRSAWPSKSGALIVGGVDYAETPDSLARGSGRTPVDRGPIRSRLITRWPALGETLGEAEAVAEIFREAHPGEAVDLLTGDRATKAALVRRLANRRLVHLATHGYFDAGREPIAAFGTSGVSAQFDSYLVLAGANQVGVDALLTAEEVGRLDFRGVDLVVLSACQSGLGHIRAGQGDIGLLGALDRAGAGAVISTLWEVGDEPSKALMRSFYRHLWADGGSLGPAGALRAAQRDLIQGAVVSRDGGSFAHPHDWAAFVLGGDPASPVRP